MNPASTFSGKDFKKSSTCEERCYARSKEWQGVDKIPSVEIETQHGKHHQNREHLFLAALANLLQSQLKLLKQMWRATDRRVVKVKVMKEGNITDVVWKVCIPRTTSQKTKHTRILIKSLRRQWKKLTMPIGKKWHVSISLLGNCKLRHPHGNWWCWNE